MKRRKLPITVWEDSKKALRVLFYEADSNLFLEFGNEWGTYVYTKISLNGFWQDICKFMELQKPEGKDKRVETIEKIKRNVTMLDDKTGTLLKETILNDLELLK